MVVRADITYLRPDFSANLTVAQADPWPAAQRFDFVVRNTVLTPQEVADYEARAKGKNGSSVYRQIALGQLYAGSQAGRILGSFGSGLA